MCLSVHLTNVVLCCVYDEKAVAGDVRVTASAALSLEMVHCVTKRKNKCLAFVRFCHTKNRKYVLQSSGSNNRKSFACIRSHVNDRDLNGKVKCDENCSLFQVRQIDFNCNQHYVNVLLFSFLCLLWIGTFLKKDCFDFLAIPEFVIYGEPQEPVLQQKSNGLYKIFFFIHCCIFNCAEMQTLEHHTKGSLSFIYSYDTNGVCHWLGTNKGADTWQNPALCGYIHVLYSSIAADSKPAHCVVGRELVRCVTEPKKLSWFVIHFKNINIIPTHYTLKYCITFDNECLRNWKFEASDDSTNGVNGQYMTIITHNNDQPLNRKGVTHIWTIPSHIVKNQHFSKFRLSQFGPNSNSHHYLHCSRFEIYGTFVSGADAPSEENGPKGSKRIFKYSQDMNFNILFYFFGTNGGKQQWTNTVDLRLVNLDVSSLMSDSAPLSALCGGASVRCVTKHYQKSWIIIDLKDIKMHLSYYTLRHYNSWDKEALRFLVLKGSDYGMAWIPLATTCGRQSVSKAGIVIQWPVETSQCLFRFRISMNGRNSNNNWCVILLLNCLLFTQIHTIKVLDDWHHLKQMFLHQWRLSSKGKKLVNGANHQSPKGVKKVFNLFIYLFLIY
ncbi:hypothetical protein RFI_06520 [Reticulomyxa filosa]|uniref:F5/8 type C domain-containing protein n=1 Tax=Reticulomyxa filosa TaxID=46433 RepID=X6NXP8_RETFI|nr:hypothetical protein RFI_06520 [Reticulomyxa filosa]|eukprot:ETO30599.1 hypothetical protein RFI_06520 [Reticulomyxa filosa]